MMLLQKYIYILTMFQVVKLKEMIISFSLTGKKLCFKHRLHKILDVTAVMSLWFVDDHPEARVWLHSRKHVGCLEPEVTSLHCITAILTGCRSNDLKHNLTHRLFTSSRTRIY